ncbi:CNNM domain-containing protein [Nocardioides sp. TF02-7]|uniref:CNNM domain-containing protein n=1 Tax=Nocardioides sp. TF02-7 TaxID=2917724 RepID=UPI001F070D95|nr:CNNM domain-containing protein [Nocardioides sp. TF02-7]UMG91624.1 CNNM domain-containing protein [Nocardioides sp. TF02-7]
MTALLTLLLGLVVVLAITAATGYFVAQEFAFMAVDRSRLKARAAAGDTSAERALRVTRRTSFMLSGAQLGITVTGLLVGYVAEPLVGDALGSLLGGVGVPTAVGVAVGTVLALAFSTVVQMLFGELFPKNLAIARPEPVADRLARSTLGYLRVTGPLIWVFDQASNLLLKAVGIEPVHDVEHSATARDLEHIVADSRESGDLPAELSVLLDRVLDFPTRDVEHAMVPRPRVDVVATGTDVAEVRRLMSTGHSRYPVLDAEDGVVGVVHLGDLLTAAPGAALADVVRPPLVVPTRMALPDALEELARTRNELAAVVDEYGGFVGVLTLEDLAEELVGELTDEHDDPHDHAPTVADAAGSWSVPGDVPVDEVERTIGHDLPTGDYQTLAGLVIAEHGRLPEPGTVVEVRLPDDPGDLARTDEPPPRFARMEVVEVEQHVPAVVRITLDLPDERGGGVVMENPVVVAVATAVIIAASAFFVAIEFALIAARKHRLEEAAPSSRAARAALRSSTELSVLLAGSQLGITVSVLALGAITKPAVHHWLTPVFEGWGAAYWLADVAGFVLALVVVTFLHLVVGEMAPKSWAIAHPERSATLLALPMRGVHVDHPPPAARAQRRRQLVPAPRRRRAGRRGRLRPGPGRAAAARRALRQRRCARRVVLRAALRRTGARDPHGRRAGEPDAADGRPLGRAGGGRAGGEPPLGPPADPGR